MHMLREVLYSSRGVISSQDSYTQPDLRMSLSIEKIIVHEMVEDACLILDGWL
jgi:hypothetical protein